jgi:aminoglycoside phosphotransferase
MKENYQSDLSSSPALSPQWLKENLPRFLWHENESPGEIVQLDILNIWESAKRKVLLYEVGLNGAERPFRQQLYVGHQVSSDRLDDEYAKALKKAKFQPPAGRAAALIPEAEMYVLAFPNDRKMRLLSEQELQAWLAEHLREVAGDELEGRRWQVLETKVELLQYVPDKRFTARCRIKIKAENGQEKAISFVAKQLSDAKKAKRLYRSLFSLRRAWDVKKGASRAHVSASPPIRFPRALAFDEKMGVVFIEEMPGKNLNEALAEIDPARVMPAVGDMLASLHLAHKRVPKKVTIKNETAEVREIASIIVAAFPHLRPRLKELFRKFKSGRWDDEAPAVLLHGTYRLNHIFINGDELALLDLDSLRVGHPAYDLANFLSSLYYLEAQERLSPSWRREIARHFLEGYAAKAPWAIPPAAVLWFLSGLLINKQAGKYVTHFHQDREEKVNRMLELAEAALAGSQQVPNDLALAALWKVLP